MMKKVLLAGLLVVALVGLPITVILFQTEQDTRTKAAASTVLSFTPTSSPNAPIEKAINSTVALDMMVNPGNNAISTMKLHIHYDPSKFQTMSGTPFVINTLAFPAIIEGPINDTNGGNIYVTISVGSDPTKAIRAPVKVGTLTLKAANPTDTSASIISFGALTQAFSVAAGDQASENVLSTATPAYVEIADIPTPTPTNTPTDTPTPTLTPVPQATRFVITAFMHGIGDSGDNANPTNSTLSNKNPLRQSRTVNVSVYNASNQLVVSKQGTVNYDPDEGNFSGIVSMGMTLVTGDYIVKVKSDGYLQKRVPAIVHIVPATQINLPAISMIVGDSNNDNTLNILDYNMLIGCYSDLLPATFCDSQKQILTDLQDDSNVNQIDYNLFLREITVQNGD